MFGVRSNAIIPSEFNNMEWLAPWIGIEPGVEAQRLKLRLRKEVREGHSLFGQHAIPLARRSDYDVVLFYLPNAVEKRLAVVHLSSSSNSQAQQPNLTDHTSEMPYTVFYLSKDHWIYRRMVPDHREITGPSEHYMETVEECRGMYDGSEPGWVLVNLAPDVLDDEVSYFPVNTLTHRITLICDDDAYEEIIRRMLRAGVPTVDSDERKQ